MVTITEGEIRETKNFSIDQDGLGRIIIPKVMTQACGLRNGQLIEIIMEPQKKEFIIRAKNFSGGVGG